MKLRAQEIIQAAARANIAIATAESCTGGMIAARLTDIAGSSAAFDRGFVTYSNEAKQEMLGIKSNSLQSFGAVSEEVAKEMANGALDRSNASLAVSVTGIAGPGGSDLKPEGRVCFGLAQKGQETKTQTIEFGALGREEVRNASTMHALELLLSALKKI